MPLPASAQAKRATAPFDDRVKARLRGDDDCRASTGCPSTNGSEYGAPDLSGFVNGFFYEGSDDGDEGDKRDVRDEDEGSSQLSDGEERQPFCAVPSTGMIRELVSRPCAASSAEARFRRDLEVDAAAAAGRFAGLRLNHAAFRRAVMGSLREMGYNAGICKSRWESGGGGLVAGSYEYIDVVTSADPAPVRAAPTSAAQQQRYIIDLEFSGEFEIARPTAEYQRLVAELPRVFVGRPEELRQLLRVLAEAARRSLRERGMHVPPWRKGRYMQAKWLGHHRRTLNPLPSCSPAAAPGSQSAGALGAELADAKCRLVGFAAAESPVSTPAAATTG